MEPNDLFKVQLCNAASIISFMAWNEVSHLEKSVHNHHDNILPRSSHRESKNEIHTHIIPRLNGHGQWGV